MGRGGFRKGDGGRTRGEWLKIWEQNLQITGDGRNNEL